MEEAAGGFPEATGAYAEITAKYFGGAQTVPADAIEAIALDKRLAVEIASSPYESELYKKYAGDKQYFLVTLPTGTMRAICYTAGRQLFDRQIDWCVAWAIRRIYQPARHLDETFFETRCDFDSSAAPVDCNRLVSFNTVLPEYLKCDENTMEKARRNCVSAGTNANQFFRAIDLLARGKTYPSEKVAVALWYLATMEHMGYRRLTNRRKKGGPDVPETDENVSGSVLVTRDLDVMDAVTFYENIHFAVEAHFALPFAQFVNWEAFLHHILPARSYREPLVRWRRLFYEALLPVVKNLHSLSDAADFVNSVAGAAAAYQAATPWEDFSPLLTLAAHEGRCGAMTALAVSLGKAIGLDIFMLRSPAWGRANGNHGWVGFVDKEGTLRSAEPCETAVTKEGLYKESKGVAKIYAYTPFDENWTDSSDVTDVFTSTGTIHFDGSQYNFADGSVYYLNVLNRGEWITAASAKANKTGIAFANAGNYPAILYNISKDRREFQTVETICEVVPPFLFDAHNAIRMLKCTAEETAGARFTITEECIQETITPGQYALMMWTQEAWKECEALLPAGEAQNGRYFPAVRLQEGRLYHLFAGEQPIGRPFIVIGGAIKNF